MSVKTVNDTPMELALEDDGDLLLTIHLDRGPPTEVYLDIPALMNALGEICGPSGFGSLLERQQGTGDA